MIRAFLLLSLSLSPFILKAKSFIQLSYSADSVSYQNATLILRSHVLIQYRDWVLWSDEIIWNQKNQELVILKPFMVFFQNYWLKGRKAIFHLTPEKLVIKQLDVIHDPQGVIQALIETWNIPPLEWQGNWERTLSKRQAIFDKMPKEQKKVLKALLQESPRLPPRWPYTHFQAEQAILSPSVWEAQRVRATLCRAENQCELLWLDSDRYWMDENTHQHIFLKPTLWFTFIPIWGVPRLSFPAQSDMNQMGFLFPHLSLNRQYGLEIGWPLFFPLHPSVYLTWTPYWRTDYTVYHTLRLESRLTPFLSVDLVGSWSHVDHRFSHKWFISHAHPTWGVGWARYQGVFETHSELLRDLKYLSYQPDNRQFIFIQEKTDLHTSESQLNLVWDRKLFSSDWLRISTQVSHETSVDFVWDHLFEWSPNHQINLKPSLKTTWHQDILLLTPIAALEWNGQTEFFERLWIASFQAVKWEINPSLMRYQGLIESHLVQDISLQLDHKEVWESALMRLVPDFPQPEREWKLWLDMTPEKWALFRDHIQILQKPRVQRRTLFKHALSWWMINHYRAVQSRLDWEPDASWGLTWEIGWQTGHNTQHHFFIRTSLGDIGVIKWQRRWIPFIEWTHASSSVMSWKWRTEWGETVRTLIRWQVQGLQDCLSGLLDVGLTWPFDWFMQLRIRSNL